MLKESLDFENEQEKLTPYMLAVLRRQTDVAEALLATGKVNKDYVNSDGEKIEAITKRMLLKAEDSSDNIINGSAAVRANITTKNNMIEDYKRSESPDAINSSLDRS